MKTKFTSGEWVAEELVTCCIISSEDRVIGESFRAEDAHLIAAAPEMYRELLDILDDSMDCHDYDRIEKLLAKARGE